MALKELNGTHIFVNHQSENKLVKYTDHLDLNVGGTLSKRCYEVRMW